MPTREWRVGNVNRASGVQPHMRFRKSKLAVMVPLAFMTITVVSNMYSFGYISPRSAGMAIRSPTTTQCAGGRGCARRLLSRLLSTASMAVAVSM